MRAAWPCLRAAAPLGRVATSALLWFVAVPQRSSGAWPARWSPLKRPQGPARSVGTAVTCGRLPVLVGDEVAWCSPSEVAARPCSDATAPPWPAAVPSHSPRACLARYEQCVEQHGWEHRKWHQHHDVERHNLEQYRVACVSSGPASSATSIATSTSSCTTLSSAKSWRDLRPPLRARRGRDRVVVAIALVEAWLACWATLEAAARPCPRAAGAPPWPATLAAPAANLTSVFGAAGGCLLALLDSKGIAVACCRLATPVEYGSHMWVPLGSAARPWSRETASP